MIKLAEKPSKQLMMKKEKNGAGEETRTLDSHLGKVALYQLSYTRSQKSGQANYRNKGGLQHSLMLCFSLVILLANHPLTSFAIMPRKFPLPNGGRGVAHPAAPSSS